MKLETYITNMKGVWTNSYAKETYRNAKEYTMKPWKQSKAQNSDIFGLIYTFYSLEFVKATSSLYLQILIVKNVDKNF